MPDIGWIHLLIAQAEGQAEAPGGGALSFLPPLIIMFLIFYFVLIRPEQKKQAKARQMLNELKEGENIVTLSGIHGTIKKIKDDVVTLQVADNVRIKIERSAIGRVRGAGTESKNDGKKEKDKDKDSGKDKEDKEKDKE